MRRRRVEQPSAQPTSLLPSNCSRRPQTSNGQSQQVLLSTHDAFGPAVRNRATHWYDGAQAIAERFAAKYDTTPEQAAGVLAVLSPQKDWFMNVAQAEQVMDIWFSHQDTLLSEDLIGEQRDEIILAARGAKGALKKKPERETAGETKARLKYNQKLHEAAQAKRREVITPITGKKIKNLKGEDLGWAVRVLAQSVYGRSYQVISPEGESLGQQLNSPDKKGREAPSKNGWGAGSEIIKAFSILEEGGLENISEQLGQEHKVRNFYNNIAAPNSPHGDITIDTHAVAAAHLMPWGSSAAPVHHNFGGKGAAGSGKIGISGFYHLYVSAYSEAAKERGIQPRQMQSIVWEAVRQLYPAASRRDKTVLAFAKKSWKRTSDDSARSHILATRPIDVPPWAGRSNDVGQPTSVAGAPPRGRSQLHARGGLQFGSGQQPGWRRSLTGRENRVRQSPYSLATPEGATAMRESLANPPREMIRMTKDRADRMQRELRAAKAGERASKRNERQEIAGLLRELLAIKNALPVTVRGKLTGDVKLADLPTLAARQRFLEGRLARGAELLEAHLKKTGLEEAAKLFKRSQAKTQESRKQKGKLGGVGHQFFTDVEETAGKSAADIEREVLGIDSQLEKCSEFE
jgi:hypothetical protein